MRPPDLASAASIIAAVIPHGNDWCVYGLTYEASFHGTGTRTSWNLYWKHRSEAHGSITAESPEELANLLGGVIKDIESLPIRRRVRRDKWRRWMTHYGDRIEAST